MIINKLQTDKAKKVLKHNCLGFGICVGLERRYFNCLLIIALLKGKDESGITNYFIKEEKSGYFQ